MNNNGNSGRLDYNQFKRILEVLSTKVFKDYPAPMASVDLLKYFILPTVSKLNDKRCIHNRNIQVLLTQLDNQDMITLLTLLHKSIIDVYKVYSDKKSYMNFSQYVTFCTDFDIFPSLITKAALYRIFHSLSFMNEVLGGNKNMTMSKSVLSSKFNMGKGQ